MNAGAAALNTGLNAAIATKDFVVNTGTAALNTAVNTGIAAKNMAVNAGIAAKDYAVDTGYAALGTGAKVLSQTRDVGNYALEGALSPLLYARDGLAGTAGYLAQGAQGVLGYAAQGLTGTANYGLRGLTGTAEYLRRGFMGVGNFGLNSASGLYNYTRDTLVEPLKFVGGLPGALRGAPQHAIRDADGNIQVVPRRRGGIGPLMNYAGRGVLRAGSHLIRGLEGTVMAPYNATMGTLGYLGEGVTGVGNYLTEGATGTADYLGQGRDRALAHTGAGVQGALNYVARGGTGALNYLQRGASGAINNLGYFRGAALALGGLGSVASSALGYPALNGLAAGALPYGFDLLRYLQTMRYERGHTGYHSMERHAAWYSSGNMKNRLNAVGGGFSRMRNWGMGRVRSGPSSGQFRTENWHLYSIEQGEEQVRALSPGANFTNANVGPPYIAGFRFTIQYPGWDTGISYSPGGPEEGERTEYVFYNFNRDAPGSNNFFLAQHYPVTGPQGAAPNYVVNTRRPI
ncbi:MAG: hypothetical protein IPK82_00780 [Polyangiaceae bacterium]|nr:hypothetical protein [Polyangiaceae bacterium]